MSTISLLSRPAAGSADMARNSSDQISKAAHEFEAILLHSLLEPLQKSFARISNDSDPAGQSDYEYMGTEALASALASSGGLGIAGMITKQLNQSSSK